MTLFSKMVCFLVKNEKYVRNDGVGIGCPLGPILANVFMVKRENLLFPRLHHMSRSEGTI